jgi:hypothetical protein
MDLEPGHDYAWALRTRMPNDEVSGWNAHRRLIFVGLGFHRRTGAVYFSTPAAPEPDEAS